ncbi:hypothetical protein N7509_011315 [Penicillium cosmopolitanum]|uniref:Tetratricopeptide repeat protein 1 n=1 Tax=Penicillium cosmopolitanum TaxID=1131564 RepID=A0A9X0B5C3_9EURO|nr:uncharacterized protein N7509_011315 [Penicillium cosmopolitanum]KAJ5388774.1 hypothetical protein N7509_011315 [Penicillium cosmopolitanum]
MTSTSDSLPARTHPTEKVAADGDESDEEDVFHDARFPAEEEERLLKEAHEIKIEANQLFGSKCYDQAISCYDRALSSCPNYLDYDVAVLRSNIAACYLKLEDWKAAVDSATASIERLDKIIPPSSQEKVADASSESTAPTTNPQSNDEVVEISGDDEEAVEKQLKRLKEQDEQRTNVSRIRAKALMRRAKAKSQLAGWANLQGAMEDYQVLAGMDTLPQDEKRIVQRALRELPERLNQAKEKEMGEMMSKMKDLGNGLLKPFGLSTDNFNFVQDPNTGGYSMNFQS